MQASAAEYYIDAGGSFVKLAEHDVLSPGDVLVLGYDYAKMFINAIEINDIYVPATGGFAGNNLVGWHVDDNYVVTKIEVVNDNEDSPRPMYYITLSRISSCTHTYAQTIIIPATSETDAQAAWVCTACGATKEGTERVVVPNSAYGYFLDNMSEQIMNVPVNGEVVVETETWVSFSKGVMEALAARPDVSLTVEYLYEGRYYTLTIPAGYDVMSLLDENGYAGFRWGDQFVGGREIEK